MTALTAPTTDETPEEATLRRARYEMWWLANNGPGIARRGESMAADGWAPTYSTWRHGGWYVDNIAYPSGACGCVSRNYADRKWRIVCDPRPFAVAPTFRNRDEAAFAERALALAEWAAR